MLAVIAKEYGQRPSHIMGITDTIQALYFDEVVTAIFHDRQEQWRKFHEQRARNRRSLMQRLGGRFKRR